MADHRADDDAVTLPGGGEGPREEVLGDLNWVTNPQRLGTEVVPSRVITDKTRRWIALYLTIAVIVVSLVFTIVTAMLMWAHGSQPSSTDGEGGVNDLDKLMPFVTLVVGQTLYPLTTIAIGWYFAARQNESTGGGNTN